MKLKHILDVTITGLLIYFIIASITWQVRNPKANRLTIYTHLFDVLKFKTIPEFQK